MLASILLILAPFGFVLFLYSLSFATLQIGYKLLNALMFVIILQLLIWKQLVMKASALEKVHNICICFCGWPPATVCIAENSKSDDVTRFAALVSVTSSKAQSMLLQLQQLEYRCFFQ